MRRIKEIRLQILVELHRHFDYKIGRPNQNDKQFLESLKPVLRALKTPGEEDWTRRIEIVEACLSEINQTQDSRSNPETVERAIINLRAMLVAMKQRDRIMTRQMGRAAFSALSNG